MNCELIKVCGMRDADNIRAVEALGIDWLGLIFWPRSSRYVAERPAYLPARCKRVGVFVDATVEDVVQHTEDYALDVVQLHGHESPDYIRALRAACSVDSGIPAAPAIVKAISVSTRADIATHRAYDGLVDYFLFDTKCKTVGGSGEQFDWTVLADYVGESPFLLSGGIGPDDAERVLAFRHPRCIGIDLNSRFEQAPALKNVNLLQSFINKIRHNEQNQ